MSPQLEEVAFPAQPPTIHQIVRQLQQCTGQRVRWQTLTTTGPLSMYQLINASDPADSVGLYQTNDAYAYLCCDQPYSALAQALLQTLISLGGVYEETRPTGTAESSSSFNRVGR